MNNFLDVKKYIEEKRFIDIVLCYQKVIDNPLANKNDKEKAKSAISLVFNHSTITALDLNNIAVLYDGNNAISQNYEEEKLWLEKALKKYEIELQENETSISKAEEDLAKKMKDKDISIGATLIGSLATAAVFLMPTTLIVAGGGLVLNATVIALASSASVTSVHTANSFLEITTVDGLKLAIEKFKVERETLLKNRSITQCNRATVYFNLGMTHRNHGDFVTSARYFQQAHDQGYAKAQEQLNNLLVANNITSENLNNIGEMYYYGEDIKQKNYKSAKLWYESAYQKGHAMACYNLGFIYKNQLEVAKNLVKAACYFQQALDRGYIGHAKQELSNILSSEDTTPTELNNIGVMYHKGEKIKQRDYREAMFWYNKACAQKSGIAYRNRGKLYHHGYGVSQDLDQAEKDYNNAVINGYYDARHDLDCLRKLKNETSKKEKINSTLFKPKDDLSSVTTEASQLKTRVQSLEIKNNMMNERIIKLEKKTAENTKIIISHDEDIARNTDAIDALEEPRQKSFTTGACKL